MSVETVVFDAGARYGVHPTWENYAAELRYLMFDSDPEESARLCSKYQGNADIYVEATALGHQVGRSTMNVLRHRGQSPFFS